MDVLQICRQLRPGTAWTMTGTDLIQAEDGTARVSVPTQQEIDDYVAANPEPPDLPSLQDQINAIVNGGSDLAALKTTLDSVAASKQLG